MRLHKWTYKTDNENECYKILTEDCVQEHDGVPERMWIASVYELDDTVEIISAHNYMVENSSTHNTRSRKFRPNRPSACVSCVNKCKQSRWIGGCMRYRVKHAAGARERWCK